MLKRNNIILSISAVLVILINTVHYLTKNEQLSWLLYDIGIFSSILFPSIWVISKSSRPNNDLILPILGTFLVYFFYFKQDELAHDVSSRVLILGLWINLTFKTYWTESIQKTVCIYFTIDSIKELIEMMIFGDYDAHKIGFFIQQSLFIVTLLYGIYRQLDTLTKYSISKLEVSSVYLALKSPRSFKEWLFYLLTISYGRFYLMLVDDSGQKIIYKFKRSSKKLKKIKLTNHSAYPEHFCLIKLSLPMKSLEKSVDLLLNSKHRMITGNCYTIFRKSMYEHNVRKGVLDIIPFYFIKNLIKQKNHEQLSGYPNN